MIKLHAIALAAASAAAISGAPQAGATETVTFDSGAYCAQVAAAIGGSYRIEEACLRQEDDARRAMPAAGERIAGYCLGVAEAIGGSYKIYNACVSQEQASRARISAQ